MWRPLVLAAACAFLSTAAEPPTLRLDGNVVPQRYRLDLSVAPERETFGGSIDIDVTIARPTPVVWLNSRGLNISSAVIRYGKGQEQTARVAAHGKDFIGLRTEAPVPAGRAAIVIHYSGKFQRNGLDGLHTRQDGGEWYAYTDFEPLDARVAFPCFDEPVYKAPWEITLRVPPQLKAFSNAPEAHSSEQDGLKVVRFKPTQPISTYLVAFAVGPFDVVDAGVAGRNKTHLRIIVPKGRAARTQFSREVTPKIFEAVEKYFDIPYPFDKLDQIAFPYNAGAMENAGLITYGHQLLVAPSAGESTARKRSAAGVIAHEIAHQWFGDLVTMRWWDDIWLNEAFATWMRALIVNEIAPEWNALAYRQSGKALAISQDRLISARKIRQPAESEGDIVQAFDAITYQKGATVIGMFENFIGPRAFRRGVQTYIRKHAWGNTTAADFLTALSSSAGRDVTRPFSTFLDRPGAPLLRVRLDCDGPPRALIQQERLLPLGSAGDRNAVWQVPVCLRYPVNGGTATQCAILADPRQTVALDKTRACPEWLYADADGAGYYSVIYEQGLGTRLSSADGLSPLERVNVLQNAEALLGAGLIAPDEPVRLAVKFAQSGGRDLVDAANQIFSTARRLVTEQRVSAFEDLVSRALAQRARKLGWHAAAGEDDETRLTRASVFTGLLSWGRSQEIEAEARDLAIRWLADRKAIDMGIAPVVLRGAAIRGDSKLFAALRSAAEQSDDVLERGIAAGSMGLASDAALARQALDWILQTQRPPNERMIVINEMRSRPQSAPILWEFIKQNYDRLLDRLPNAQSVDRGTLMIGMASGLCTRDAREDVRSFFGPKAEALPGGPRALARTLETIDLCVARREALEPQMSRYLDSLTRSSN